MNSKKVLSAQVVLAAAGGARPGPKTRITSENIGEWAPSAETIKVVSAELRAMGFDVGACVGNSMSITGTVRLFESRFRTKIQEAGEGVKFAEGGVELADKNIPAALRPHVTSITFTPPPDFGPGGGFM